MKSPKMYDKNLALRKAVEAVAQAKHAHNGAFRSAEPIAIREYRLIEAAGMLLQACGRLHSIAWGHGVSDEHRFVRNILFTVGAQLVKTVKEIDGVTEAIKEEVKAREGE